MNSAYECELCGDRLTSYRAMMECEARCEAEDAEARKGHVSPRTIRHGKDWDED